ncbi:hypothetical protein BGZ63DRAFT_421165 [Mariannaea sp. PMI_226]|nr:hypothetical protein BGZ63DRAFT_421165 [Mariannaea sp. PMI_226]
MEAGQTRNGYPPGPSPEPTSVLTKRRGTVACRRCRRLRSKCIHKGSIPPCDACQLAGPQAAAECNFPRRGEKDVDRLFRRRPAPTITGIGPGLGPGLGQAPGQQGGVVLQYPARGGNISPPRQVPLLSTSQSQKSERNSDYSPWASPPGSDGPSPSEIRDVPATIGKPPSFPAPNHQDDVLPCPEDVIEGCRVFVTSYFQLGFLPKAVFLETLRVNPGSVSKFLLACILSISARFTPALISRYGNARKATDHFLEVARSMVPSEMYQPSLERIQAFFLLAISQWGNDDKDRSNIDMGVAVRMAALLKLHCEESYALDAGCPTDQIVRSESARRVFWMIQSQENLHSGYKTPAPFPLEDITTLLPCDEGDFAFGAIPAERAAEAGTPPALANPDLVFSPQRCLFATLIQAHGLWGRVARRACRNDKAINKAPPWDPNSEYQRTVNELRHWEKTLPPKHAFSVWNLRGWKSESLHLAYLSITMVLRLSNIVARRVYLQEMLGELTNEPLDEPLEPTTPTTMANADDKIPPPTSNPTPTPTPRENFGSAAPDGFWAQASNDLFQNVWELYEQIDAYFSMKSSGEGFPQILVFCVYMCGSLSSFLWRYPALSPQLGERGEMMAQRSLEVLSDLHAAWPTSSTWQKGLQQIATPQPGVHLENSYPPAARPPQPKGSDVALFETTAMPQILDHGNIVTAHESIPRIMERRPTVPQGMLEELINVIPNGSGNLVRLGSMQMDSSPSELLDAELAAFLQGDVHYDLWDGWGQPGITG